ncbi:MAG: hypothetical protein FWH38_01875 [Treponema sp.]|nr:hypothetical protein [Treponema sp.]
MAPEKLTNTVLYFAGIVASGFCVLVIGTRAVIEAFKTKRKSIDLKKQLSKAEVEIRNLEAMTLAIKALMDTKKTEI